MGSIRSLLRTGGNSSKEESCPASARAEGLLQEFESSGKGWFWETGRDGDLTYISDSVAAALGREAGDLLGRPFTDLISTETADGSATSERTLGFYLSSHVAFQDLIVRAKTKNEIWWSISGRPIHDEIGRRAPHLLEPLYRGFHYHRLGEEGPDEEPVTPYRMPVFAISPSSRSM